MQAVVAIGLALAVAQPLRAQEPGSLANGGLGTVGGRDEALRERLVGLLLRPATRDRPAGWALCAQLGRPVVPLLWRQFELEKDVESRLVLLAAAMVAGDANEDDLWFQWLAQNEKKQILRERTLVALLLALGPDRQRPVANYWTRCFGVGKDAKDQERLLTIAARLAAGRFPGTTSGVGAADDDDVGAAAAAAWAGLPVLPSLAQRLWNTAAPEEHAELFWRGAMLGAARGPDRGQTPAVMIERARRLLDHPGAAVAPAAMWLLARSGALRPEGARPEAPLLRIVAGDPAVAARLLPWFGVEPLPRDDEPQRLAVAYVFARAPEAVLAERERWPVDPEQQRHFAVALACRIAGAVTPVDLDGIAPLGVPEWNFVRAAAGAGVTGDVPAKDAQLQVAMTLLRDGRLDRRALRHALEDALWRWGSHPRRSVWELERVFVRDLLLAGSTAGGARWQSRVPPNRRYCPTGLDRDDPFFRVAVDVFQFLATPRGPVPSEHRLPD